MKNLLLKIATILLAPVFSVSAANLDLAKEPLELSQSVEPNVMLLIDDSGSMDFEVMTEDFGEDGTLLPINPMERICHQPVI